MRSLALNPAFWVLATLTAISMAACTAHSEVATAARIHALRVSGRHSEALHLARAEVGRLQREAKPPWAIREAAARVVALERAAAATKEDRNDFVRADSLDDALMDMERHLACVEGEAAAQQQLEIRSRLLGPSHLETLESQQHLAVFQYCVGKLDEAEGLAQKALLGFREVLGEDAPTFATVLHDLGAIAQADGRYHAADSLYQRALQIHRKSLSDDDPLVLIDLNDLGMLRYASGDLFAAETMLRHVVARRRALLDPRDPILAQSIGNLATILADRGDPMTAEALYRETLSVLLETSGPRSYDTAIGLNNLATCLIDLESYDAGDSLLEQYQSIAVELFGEVHADVSLALLNRGMARQRSNASAAAEPLFRRSLDIAEKALGPEHPQVALCLNNLGVSLLRQARFLEAESQFQRAVAIRRNALGGLHPDVLVTLVNLAELRRRRGDARGAEAHLAEAARIFESARLRVTPGEARAMFESSPYPLLASTRLILNKQATAWTAAEGGMGRLAGEMLLDARRRALNPIEATQEDSLSRSLRGLEDELRALQGADSPDDLRRLASTKQRLAATEAMFASLVRRISDLHPFDAGGNASLTHVQASLKENSAILGWVDDAIVGGDSTRRVWAYVVRRKGPVNWFELPRTTGSLERQLHSAIRSRSKEDARLLAKLVTQVYTARFAAVEPTLKGVEDLVVLPSGAMLGIPIEALVDVKGEYLGDRFRLHYCPSATVHAWLVAEARRPQVPQQPRRALFLADPAFNAAQAEEMIAERKRNGAPTRGASTDENVSSPNRGIELLRSALGGNRQAVENLTRLWGTRHEVEASSRALGYQSTVLMAIDASEERLLGMAPTIDEFAVIHLATHALIDDRRPGNCALILSQVGLPDPFACAQSRKRIVDGRWTAREVLDEWRLNADLVVLSACETALGRQVTGEGYLGFAHAFLRAGARHLLLSLWQVDDRATALLMESFYRNLASTVPANHRLSGELLGEALRRARMEVRDYTIGNDRPYAHPRYWAGFILVGAADGQFASAPQGAVESTK